MAVSPGSALSLNQISLRSRLGGFCPDSLMVSFYGNTRLGVESSERRINSCKRLRSEIIVGSANDVEERCDMTISNKSICGAAALAAVLLSAPIFGATNFVQTNLIADTPGPRRGVHPNPGGELGSSVPPGAPFSCLAHPTVPHPPLQSSHTPP